MFVKFKLKAQHTCLLACFSALDTGSLGERCDNRTLMYICIYFWTFAICISSVQCVSAESALQIDICN